MDFKQALGVFFTGEIDVAELQHALRETLQREPHRAPELVTLLDGLYARGRLPLQLHALLRQQIAGPPSGAPGRSGPPGQSPPGSATGPPASSDPPTGQSGWSQPGQAPPQPGQEPPAPQGPQTGQSGWPPPGQVAPGAATGAPESGADDDHTRFQVPPAERPTPTHPGMTSPPGPPGYTPTVPPQGPVPGSTGTPSAGYQAGTGMPSTGSSGWSDPAQWTGGDLGGTGEGAALGINSVIKSRFVLEKLIGAGGMGVVYKARDLRKEEAQDRHPYVALKVLSEEFKRHPDSLKALQREARKAQQLAHPNIVNVYDFDRDGTTVYMTMELLEGEPLDYLIKRHATGLPWHQARPIIRSLSLALAYAHDKGVVHSDFKPGNAFLTNDGTVKVFDFGIARAAKRPGEEGETTMFDAGKLEAKTLAYASCEMIDGEEPDQRDDIYALALTAYELLSGKHPFSKIPAAQARDSKIVPDRIKGLRRYQHKALLRGLAFEREKRTPTAFVFLDEISPQQKSRNVIAVAGIAVMVLLGILALVVVPPMMKTWQLKRLSEQLKTGTPSEIASAVTKIEALESEDVTRLKTEFNADEPLIEYFTKDIRDSFNPDNGKFDYPGAAAELERLKAIAQDTVLMVDAIQLESEITQDRNEVLDERDRSYNENLVAGRIVPVDGPDIQDDLAVLRQVAPDHPLLLDVRLIQRYATEAEIAMQSSLGRADQLVGLGLGLAPQDRKLVDLRSQIDTLQEQMAEADLIRQLETGLDPQISALGNLAAVDRIRGDIGELAKMSPDSEVLARVRAAVLQTIKTPADEHIEFRRFDQAMQLLNNYRDVLGGELFEQQQTAIASQRAQFEERVATLSEELGDAITAGRLDGAGRNTGVIVADLEAAGAGETVVNDGRDQIARAWLDRASTARQKQNWDAARDLVETGLTVVVSPTLRADLENERRAISNLEVIAEQEVIKQQIDRLASDFRRALTARDLNVKALVDTIDRLDDAVAGSGVPHPAPTGLDLIGQRVDEQARQLADGGDFAAALALIAKAVAALPAESTAVARLGATQGELEQLRRAQLAEARQRQIQDIVTNIDALLAQPPPYSARMHTELKEHFAQLGQDAPDIVRDKKQEAGFKYLQRAQQRREDGFFSEADILLQQAAEIVPDLPGLGLERETLKQAQNEYEQKIIDERRVAEINALKGSFSAQIKNNKPNDAAKTLEKYKKEAGDDQWVTEVAPTELANAFKLVAEANAARKRWSSAVTAADRGLKYRPDLPGLKDLRRDYQFEADKQRIRDVLSSGTSSQIRGLTARIGRVKGTADYRQFEREIVQRLLDRIRGSRDSDPDSARALKDAGLKLFPNNADLVRIETLVASTTVTKPTPEPIPEPVQVQGSKQNPRSCDRNGLAGQGKSKRARCNDMLSDTERGPQLVVVGGGSFAITPYEISVGDFNLYCMLSGECLARSGDTKQPLTNIAAADIVRYAGWLTLKTGRTYRLPDEEQWEFAARAGGAQPTWNFNCYAQQGGTQIKGFELEKVDTGSQANGWGLLNYLGNAQELVRASSGYVARGGAYTDSISECQIEFSRPHNGQADNLTGFRLVRER